MENLGNKVLACALVALAVVAGVASPAGAQAGEALVRVAHLSPDTEGIDLYLDGEAVVQNIGFDTVSDYLGVPAGRHRLEAFPSGAPEGTEALLDLDTDLVAGAAYTVAGVGLREDLRAELLTDDLSAPPAGQAKLRAIHAALGVEDVDVVLSGQPALFEDAGPQRATPYAAVPPGTYDVEVRAAGTDEVLLEARQVELAAGIVYSLAAIGGGPSPLRLLPVVDARGAAVAAVGGVATGAGGTADRGTGSGAPLLVVGAGLLGVLVLADAARRRATA